VGKFQNHQLWATMTALDSLDGSVGGFMQWMGSVVGDTAVGYSSCPIETCVVTSGGFRAVCFSPFAPARASAGDVDLLHYSTIYTDDSYADTCLARVEVRGNVLGGALGYDIRAMQVPVYWSADGDTVKILIQRGIFGTCSPSGTTADLHLVNRFGIESNSIPILWGEYRND